MPPTWDEISLEGRLGILTAVFEAASIRPERRPHVAGNRLPASISSWATSPWLLCFGAYVWPWLKSMDRVEAQRAIATLHSFRFFGLVFILPGVVGPDLPAGFAAFAAYGDFATGVLAMLALSRSGYVRSSGCSSSPSISSGSVDLLVDYYHGVQVGLPALAGELGATYAIPIIYVPLLMITHVAAFYLLRAQREAQAPAAGAVAI